MEKYSFYLFLKEHAELDDPTGDLANDVLGDKKAPKQSNNFWVWDSHLRSKKACQEALDVLRDAFREYWLMEKYKRMQV